MQITSLDDSVSGTTAGAGAVEINLDMNGQRQYRLVAKGNLWFRVVAAGGAGAAIAGAGSHYLADGHDIPVAAIGTTRTRISIIRDGATDVTGCLSVVPKLAAL